MTALDLGKTKAVLRHVGADWTEEVDGSGTVYYRGKFEKWDIVVVEAGPGNNSTAVLASAAAVQYRPDLSFFVGIGGGVKDVKLGDVVVATKGLRLRPEKTRQWWLQGVDRQTLNEVLTRSFNARALCANGTNGMSGATRNTVAEKASYLSSRLPLVRRSSPRSAQQRQSSSRNTIATP